MHNNSKKFMVLLIALAIALLPIRFGHAVGVDAHIAAGVPNSSHHDMHDCNLDENRHASDSCDGYSPDGSLVDDCCGDQCSGAQLILTSVFNLHFTPSHSYDMAWSQWLPEPIISAEFRPPINLS